MVEGRCCLQREEVYRWFSGLNSAQRTEFLCGLLDLCVPVELRFLGSCLEDLARKDYHSLRDAEIKANNPADLAHLANITDEVVRSKLLVSLALLSSDNRAAAAVLFRTLTHIDAVINNYGLQLNDGRTGEQFLLLFTMASNHPAFSFHQKQVLRQQLAQIQEILQVTVGDPASSATAPSYLSPTGRLIYRGGPCPCCAKPLQKDVMTATVDEGLGSEVMPPTPASTCQDLPVKMHAVKPGKIRVERIELKGVTHKADMSAEYTLEVLWSDSTLTTVGKTSQELVELVSQLSRLFPDDCLERFLPPSILEPAHELDPRCLSSFPLHVLRHDRVRLFFSCSSTPPLPANNLSCLLQYRGANRTVCGVASIQPVINVHAPIPQPSPPQMPSQQTLPLHPALPLGDSSSAQNHPSLVPHPQSQPPVQQQPHSHHQTQSQPSPEQNGILDWLRKLRLHKYYPVFKQLTMEEFLALTEEDLNKYDLTQGAKKKLKTQLELQKEKLEKRHVMSQFPVSCGGVARVTPSSYNGPLTHTHPSSSNTELRVEVEPGSLPVLRDSSSSSGYSSAPSSPMTPLSRDASFERAKEPHRRVDSLLEPGEKERPCFLLNTSGSASPCRPTAQVLPVQNDPSLSASHLNSFNLSSLPLLSPGRGINSARKTRPPPICSEDRPKPTGAGVAIGGRLESLFPCMSVDTALQGHQDGPGARGPLAGLRSPPGLMVETSTALTATSNTLHHVSHPPLHLQVSPSPANTRSNQYPHTAPSSCTASPSLASKPAFLPVSAVPVATATSVPVAAVSGNTYSINSPSIAPPSTSPITTEAVGYGQANGASSGSAMCVCSSCGCSGNCGSYGTLPASYGGYFPHPFSGTSVFTLGPLLHFSPLITGSGSASPFSYPLVAPPLYNSSLSHDSQQNLVLPSMQGFLGGGANVYQPHGITGNGGTGQKKTGNMSCYNCGLSGHRAQDCKQPPMDSTQQGMFRLKYSPQSDSQDSGD